ncbi:hypothetical protein QZM74_29090, partial [Burkholderia multivorans]|nr:hypothetical protein [Burkholderia multivorans]
QCPKFVINDWLTHLLGPSVTMAKVNRMLKKLTALGLFLKPSLSRSDRLGPKDAKLSPPMTTKTLKPCDGVDIILVELLKWESWTKTA